jgi:response regulator RpfG family c-di-GMP phosphodiesterase
MHCRILIIDDDPGTLNALRRELIRPPLVGTDGIEIESFGNPLDALARASQPDGYFDVAIVDYHMPPMDGITCLERLREIQPEMIRILLTGLVDTDAAIAAINSARVDHLLAKPWHEFDLKGRIALALHQRALQATTPPIDVAEAANYSAPFHLLLVDDDKATLNALTRELSLGSATRGAHPLFEISAVSSPDAALEAVKNRCPDLVLADYAMPRMNGITLLHYLRKTCPQCVRILISGHADVGILAEAINVAGVYHFISKPWAPTELRRAIAEALAYRDILRASPA